MKALLKCFPITLLSLLGCIYSSDTSNPDQILPEDNFTQKDAIEQAYRELTLQGKLQLDFGAHRKALDPDNLYGQFYDERAAYYIIERPEIFVGPARVLELTLYFIDDILLRKKYELHRDISRDLILAHGNFRYKSMDKSSAEIVQAGGFILDSNKSINQELTGYKLTWEVDGGGIEMIVRKDSVRSSYIYIEEHPDYQRKLSMAQMKLVELD